MTNPDVALARVHVGRLFAVTETSPPAAIAETDDSIIRARLALLRSGDEAAWTGAFRELWPVVLRAARYPAAGLTPGEAEDVASEALVQLIPRVGQVASMAELVALAATIAHRRAISAARAKSAIKRGPVPSSLEDSAGGLLALHEITGPDIGLSEMEYVEMALLLRVALDGLAPETRELVRDKIVAGLSYQELSVKYQIPLGTACAKVARSLQQIRKRLEDSPALMKELKGFLR